MNHAETHGDNGGMRDRGLFITFEGSEGCGKSTQARLLDRWMRELGRKTRLTREPGGTPAGDRVRHLLQHAPEGHGLCPEAELFLFEASRAQLVAEVIRPCLEGGTTVICDRFHDSTTVYQGAARRLPAEMTRAANAFAIGDILPDITFLLDMSAERAFSRIRGRDLDRMESEPISFYETVRSGYLEEARRSPGRFVIMQADMSEEEVADRIRATLVRRFPATFQTA